MKKCKICGSKDVNSDYLMDFQSGSVYVSGNHLVYNGWDYYDD